MTGTAGMGVQNAGQGMGHRRRGAGRSQEVCDPAQRGGVRGRERQTGVDLKERGVCPRAGG